MYLKQLVLRSCTVILRNSTHRFKGQVTHEVTEVRIDNTGLNQSCLLIVLATINYCEKL